MTLALVMVAVLLALGLVLRLTFAPFRWLYIPASVIAGTVGLALVQTIQRIDVFAIDSVRTITQDLVSQWNQWPGWLIAVVFATLLLEKRSDTVRAGIKRTTSQIVMVWIIVLGQTAIGLLATWLFVKPFFDVPNSFGMLIETGFAGGHGTAGAMGLVFAHPQVNLEGGLDLGILMATAGLIYGVVSGIMWINIASAVGWIKLDGGSTPKIGEIPAQIAHKRELKPIGYQVIERDIIDPLLIQMIWIALAVGLGFLIQFSINTISIELDNFISVSTGVDSAEEELRKRLRPSTILGNIPLFIYTLIGGWIVRRSLKLIKADNLIDNDSTLRLSAVAMDILVVAAICSLRIESVSELIVPFLILLTAGIIWTGVCLMLLSRMILPREHWFQLGLINYGMSTGTTATGFVLLRVVDPELRTQAAEDYALAAPFSAPFIGGGILTVALPLLVLERLPISVSSLTLTACVIGLIVLGVFLNRPAEQSQQ